MKVLSDGRAGKELLFSRFVDSFLADARGDDIKVFLVLLRRAGERENEVTVTELADLLDLTERTVKRALGIWEKRGALSLLRDSAGEIGAVMILGDGENVSREEKKENTDPAPQEGMAAGEKESAAPARPGKVSDEVRSRMGQEEGFQDLVHEFSVYMRDGLTPVQFESLLYLYGELKMPYEVLSYLLELCVDRAQRSGKDKLESFRYYESIALDWHAKGITTLAAAKGENGPVPAEYYEILREYGISTSGRVITPYQKEFMQRWLQEYGFSLDLIREAIRRTFKGTGGGNVSFEYTDRILKSWHEGKVRSLEDVRGLDEKRKGEAGRKEAARNASRPGKEAPRRKNNDFHNFEQRCYNYDALMQQVRREEKV